MFETRRMWSRVGRVFAVAAVAVGVAACGGSSSSKTNSSPSGSASASNASSTSSAKGVRVGTASGPLGTYLVGPAGRALYIWAADSGGKSSCSGSCATAWPPLTTKATPTAGSGAVSSDLRTITRSDGAEQVTYKGRPLYYYAGDTGSGSTNGQGSDQFGAKWWLISPSGGTVSKKSSSGSAYGGYGGSGY